MFFSNPKIWGKKLKESKASLKKSVAKIYIQYIISCYTPALERKVSIIHIVWI